MYNKKRKLFNNITPRRSTPVEDGILRIIARKEELKRERLEKEQKERARERKEKRKIDTDERKWERKKLKKETVKGEIIDLANLNLDDMISTIDPRVCSTIEFEMENRAIYLESYFIAYEKDYIQDLLTAKYQSMNEMAYKPLALSEYEFMMSEHHVRFAIMKNDYCYQKAQARVLEMFGIPPVINSMNSTDSMVRRDIIQKYVTCLPFSIATLISEYTIIGKWHISLTDKLKLQTLRENITPPVLKPLNIEKQEHSSTCCFHHKLHVLLAELF